jgi:hypothetical protein
MFAMKRRKRWIRGDCRGCCKLDTFLGKKGLDASDLRFRALLPRNFGITCGYFESENETRRNDQDFGPAEQLLYYFPRNSNGII